MTRVLLHQPRTELYVGSSPIVDLSCALRLACDPAGREAGPLEPWWRVARAALARRPLPLAQALHEPGRYVPDFVSSKPRPTPSLPTDLAELEATPVDEVRRQMRFAYGGSVPRDVSVLMREPRAALACLCAELAAFACATSQARFARLWALGSAESWERARVLATSGAEAALTGLGPGVAFDGHALVIADGRDRTIEPARPHFTIVPTAFAGERTLVPLDPLANAGISYAPPGREAVAEGRPCTDPLAVLTGPARARLLRALAVPRSSGEVAALLGVAPSTASQQLRALWDGGLVSATRRGRHVVYALDERGRALLALLAP